MADGDVTLTLTLDDETVERLKVVAKTAGVSVEAYAAHLVERQLFDHGDFDWDGDDPREDAEPPSNPNEPTYSLDEVMTEFRDELEKRLAAKA